MHRVVLAAILVIASQLATAAAGTLPDPPKLLEEQRLLRAGIERKDARYRHLAPRDRSAILERQQALIETVAGISEWDQLDSGALAKVEADVVWIRRAVASAGEDDGRRVCELRQILGSNREERVCRTAAEKQAERDAAREMLERNRD